MELNPIDVFYESNDFVSISEFVDAGNAEVIYKNDGQPSTQRALVSGTFVLILSLALAAFAAQHVALVTDKSTVFDVPPVSLPNHIINKTKSEKVNWINTWLNKYCDTIKHSANTYNIPPRLLSAVILNELADFDAFDQTQMLIHERDYSSYGWTQLQITRVLNEHKLIDIGTKDQVSNVAIDITESENYWKGSKLVRIKFLVKWQSQTLYRNVRKTLIVQLR